METTPITIDNLPIQDHVSWIDKLEANEPKYNKDTTFVNTQTQTLFEDASKLYFEIFTGLDQKNIPWANIEEPPKFKEKKNNLFKRSVLATDKLNLLSSFLTEIDAFFEINIDPVLDEYKSAICKLLETIEYLDKLLLEIRASIIRLQKG